MMYKGKGLFEWQRTASFMTMYANAHRGKGCPAFKVDNLIPEIFKEHRQRIKLSEKDSIEFLKAVFCSDNKETK